MQYTIDQDGRTLTFRSYSADDAISRRMRKYNTFYERDLLDYSDSLLSELPAGGMVVDVGANFGNHSVYWGAVSERQVVAIEANPALTPFLEANLRNNVPDGRFTLIAGGAGERSAMGRVRPSDRAPDQFGLAGVEVVDSDASEKDLFEIHPLAVWLQRSGLGETPVRLLKIDVEGAEIAVVNGAIPILERDAPEIFAEASTRIEREALDIALAPWGYRRVRRFCSTPTWHYSTERNRLTLWRWRRLGDAARLGWRYVKLRHSIVSRMRRAS